MHRVRVKIEGLRDPQTAAEVARLGADAIGLVFADSPRRVTPPQARDVVASLPPAVATIGVFVNATAGEIDRVVEETGIGYVQLHGDEPPSLVREVHAPCIRAFRVRDEEWVEEVKAWLEGLGKSAEFGGSERGNASEPGREGRTEPGTDRCGDDEGHRDNTGFLERQGAGDPRIRPCTVLLDAYDPAVRGGSGRRFNWNLIAQARQRGKMADLGPIILAGGLDAACVGEAIRKVRPWAVDVASGVESAPGVKDLGKVRAFIEAVRSADRE